MRGVGVVIATRFWSASVVALHTRKRLHGAPMGMACGLDSGWVDAVVHVARLVAFARTGWGLIPTTEPVLLYRGQASADLTSARADIAAIG